MGLFGACFFSGGGLSLVNVFFAGGAGEDLCGSCGNFAGWSRFQCLSIVFLDKT